MSPFDSRLWFLDAIRYFWGFGFFASYSGSDEELAEVIQAYWRGDWDEFLAEVSDRPSADQLLLVADTKRVWWHDFEESIGKPISMLRSLVSGLPSHEVCLLPSKSRKYGTVTRVLLM